MSEQKFVIIHSHTDRREYFFSTDHCQGVREDARGSYPPGFVPTTFYLPQSVASRPTLPSGRVETVEDVVKVYFPDEKEIPNPDVRYQAQKKYILLKGVIPYEHGLEGNELCRFFTTYTEGKDHTKLDNGTVAYRVLGYADTIEEAQCALYGRAYT